MATTMHPLAQGAMLGAAWSQALLGHCRAMVLDVYAINHSMFFQCTKAIQYSDPIFYTTIWLFAEYWFLLARYFLACFINLLTQCFPLSMQPTLRRWVHIALPTITHQTAGTQQDERKAKAPSCNSNYRKNSLSLYSSNSSKLHGVDKLAPELFEHIFTFLSVKDFAQTAQVSQKWLLQSNDMLRSAETWHRQCLQDFAFLQHVGNEWHSPSQAVQEVLNSNTEVIDQPTYRGLEWRSVYSVLHNAERLGGVVSNGYSVFGYKISLTPTLDATMDPQQQPAVAQSTARRVTSATATVASTVQCMGHKVSYLRQSHTLLSGLYASLPLHMLQQLASSSDCSTASRLAKWLTLVIGSTHSNSGPCCASSADHPALSHTQWIQHLLLPYYLLLDLTALTATKTAVISIQHHNQPLHTLPISSTAIDDEVYGGQTVVPIFLLSHFVRSLRLLHAQSHLRRPSQHTRQFPANNKVSADPFLATIQPSLQYFASRALVTFTDLNSNQRELLEAWRAGKSL